MTMTVRKGGGGDLPRLAELACRLWPEHDLSEMQADLAVALEKTDGAFFLAFAEDRVVGFAQSQLRHDYVEGTESTPVGYLEGIYVVPEYRLQGIAKALLGACESWSKTMGCSEFASDCEQTNPESLAFHLRMGFVEANRIICFAKKL